LGIVYSRGKVPFHLINIGRIDAEDPTVITYPKKDITSVTIEKRANGFVKVAAQRFEGRLELHSAGFAIAQQLLYARIHSLVSLIT